MRANPFPGFCSRRDHVKKGHYKKSHRGYISPICGEFPTQPNITKIGLSLGVADVINRTKFGRDQSREYKVTEGRILACAIGMACHRQRSRAALL